MSKCISLLGSTGSIGRQSLDVIAACGMTVAALTANRDVERMEQQCRQFRPELAVMMDPAAANDLRVRLADTGIRVGSGMDDLIEAAKAITTDTEARYAAFAEAEAFLIDHAFVIPFSISNDGYIATRLNIFEAQYAPYGMALQSYKFQKLREEPMSMDEYNELYAQWETAREAALAAAEAE